MSDNNAPNAQIPIRANVKQILDLEGHDIAFSEGVTLRGEPALVMTFPSAQGYDAYMQALQEKGIFLTSIRESVGNGAYSIKLNTRQCVDVIQTNQANIEAEERQQYESAFNEKTVRSKNLKGTKKISNFIAGSMGNIVGGVIDFGKGKPFKAIKKYVREELESPGSKLRRFAMPMVVHSFNMEKPSDPPSNLGIDKVNVKVNLHKKEVFLNTYQYEPEALRSIPVSDKKYVVHFNGNAEFAADKIQESIGQAKDLNYVSVAFDYPGVGKPKEDRAKNTKDLVQAGIAQVKDLIKAGAKPENIVLDGHSLGGAVATLVAAQLHKEGLKVHLINGRSFSKLSTETDVFLNKNAGTLAGQMAGKENPDGSVKVNTKVQAVAPLLGKIAKAGIKAAGLEMNAAKAYKSIPSQYKTCYFAQKDEIIPFKASLAKAVGVKKDDENKGFSCSEGVKAEAGGHNNSANEIVNRVVKQEADFGTLYQTASDFKTDFMKKAFNISIEDNKKLHKSHSDDVELAFKPMVNKKNEVKIKEKDPIDFPSTFLPLDHQLQSIERDARHKDQEKKSEQSDKLNKRKSTGPGS